VFIKFSPMDRRFIFCAFLAIKIRSHPTSPNLGFREDHCHAKRANNPTECANSSVRVTIVRFHSRRTVGRRPDSTSFRPNPLLRDGLLAAHTSADTPKVVAHRAEASGSRKSSCLSRHNAGDLDPLFGKKLLRADEGGKFSGKGCNRSMPTMAFRPLWLASWSKSGALIQNNLCEDKVGSDGSVLENAVPNGDHS
jgi:hypothetical protein